MSTSDSSTRRAVQIRVKVQFFLFIVKVAIVWVCNDLKIKVDGLMLGNH